MNLGYTETREINLTILSKTQVVIRVRVWGTYYKKLSNNSSVISADYLPLEREPRSVKCLRLFLVYLRLTRILRSNQKERVLSACIQEYWLWSSASLFGVSPFQKLMLSNIDELISSHASQAVVTD